MIEWFESIAGPAYAPALMWTALALLALLLILVAMKVVRSFTSGTFIAGGRNRKARLAVLDATAIDGQRRLVLVRRDDVEHLILIGGSNDLVVEREIRAFEEEPHAETERSSSENHHETRAAPTRPVVGPRLATETRVASPSTPQPQALSSRPAAQSRPSSGDVAPVATAHQPVAAPNVGAPPRPTPSPDPVSVQSEREPRFDKPSEAPARQTQRPPQESLVAAPSPTPVNAPAPEPARREPTGPASIRPAAAGAMAAGATGERSTRHDADLDDALLEELELTLEEDDRRSTAPEPDTTRREPHLDDEMDRLLGELSSERR